MYLDSREISCVNEINIFNTIPRVYLPILVYIIIIIIIFIEKDQ